MATKKVIKPDVVRGGIAIPLKGKTNYYYMSGRKHKNGGIDIGRNPRTGLEVEDGEVMHIADKEIKVFSSVPFLNGKSPAQKVLGGENPDTVFKEQENFKDRNGLNDDGSKKKQYGGPINPIKRAFITTLTNNEESQFQDWYRKVAKHKGLNPDPDAAGQDYDYRGYWKNEDRNGILGSDPNAHFKDKYKQPSHPTFSNQSKYSNVFTPGGEWVEGKGTWLFKHNKYTSRQAKRTHDYLMDTGEGYILGTDTIIPRSKKAMGGLSRSKDYGSKSKPYPNVKSKDFAGSNRSYPIPTKADAVDALRLAGLHGRDDIKANVYSKYPELKKKAKAGGVYSVTVNGETRLKRFPSTGSRTKAALGKLDDNVPEYLRRNRDPLNVWDPLNAPQDLKDDKDNSNTLPNNRLFDWAKHNSGRLTIQNYLYNKDEPKEFISPLKSNVLTENYVPPILKDVFRNTSPLITAMKYSKATPNYIEPKNNFGNKAKEYIKEHPNTVSDAIGLASNTIGGLISHSINRRMLDKLDYFPQPMARSAAKLKTRININPQLDKMRESLAAYENDINSSTSSSNVALARRQRARFANTLQTNNIYANRENTETELINKDRLNQQSVADANVRDYNTWLQNQTTFRNSLLEKKAENDIGLIETINSGIQNTLTNREKRNTEKQNVAAMSLANPDLPVEVLYEQGLISKRVLDAYRKAYRARKKENNENNKETNNV